MVAKYGDKNKVQLFVETIEWTQNKALQILNFKGPWEGSDYLHNESKINKLKDIICHFLYDQLKNNLPETFSNFFTLNTQLHQHNTRKNRLAVPNANMTSYGYNFFTERNKTEVQKFIDIDICSPVEWPIPNF